MDITALKAAAMQYANDVFGGNLNPEFSSYFAGLKERLNNPVDTMSKALQAQTSAFQKDAAWQRYGLDAVSGSDDTRNSIKQSEIDAAMGMVGPSSVGMVKGIKNTLPEAKNLIADLSKYGSNPRDIAGNYKQILSDNGGTVPFEAIAKMSKPEFEEFYDFVASHHQGKFDRLLRSYAPQYDDLATTMATYAQDFKYENPRLVAKFKNIKPDDKVTVYRSVSKSDPDTKILPGDWVALESSYASQHGHLGDEAPRLMKMQVPAKDIRWAGTSADEYFYVPSEQIDQSVYSKYDAIQKYVKAKASKK